MSKRSQSVAHSPTHDGIIDYYCVAFLIKYPSVTVGLYDCLLCCRENKHFLRVFFDNVIRRVAQCFSMKEVSFFPRKKSTFSVEKATGQRKKTCTLSFILKINMDALCHCFQNFSFTSVLIR